MKNPNGYGSVFKMSGKRRNPWRVRKMTGRTPEGKPIYTNLGYTKTRAEGMLLLANFNTNPWDLDSKPLTFKEVCEMYFESDKRVLNDNTLRGRNTKFIACTSIHDAKIKDLKTMHLQTLIDNLSMASSSKRNVKSFLKQIFTYAIQNDIVEKNYAEFIQVDSSSDSSSKRHVFSKNEIKDIMNVDDHIRYDILKVLFFTGFRINELLDMKNESVNIEEGYMRGGSKTTAGRDRVVPISKHIEPIIRKHFNPNNTYLFTEKGNKAIMYQTFSKWFKKYVPDHVIHDTRHTFISLIAETNADRLSVKRIVGHSSSDITEEVYTHKTLEHLKSAMAHFDDHMTEFLK